MGRGSLYGLIDKFLQCILSSIMSLSVMPGTLFSLVLPKWHMLTLDRIILLLLGILLVYLEDSNLTLYGYWVRVLFLPFLPKFPHFLLLTLVLTVWSITRDFAPQTLGYF